MYVKHSNPAFYTELSAQKLKPKPVLWENWFLIQTHVSFIMLIGWLILDIYLFYYNDRLGTLEQSASLKPSLQIMQAKLLSEVQWSQSTLNGSLIGSWWLPRSKVTMHTWAAAGKRAEGIQRAVRLPHFLVNEWKASKYKDTKHPPPLPKQCSY